MKRIASIVLSASLLGSSVASASSPVGANIMLVDGQVVFIAENRAKTFVVPKRVTLMGADGCTVDLAPRQGVYLQFAALEPIASIDVRDLLQSCVFDDDRKSVSLNKVHDASTKPLPPLVPKKGGFTRLRSVPFNYMIELGTPDGQMLNRTVTDGYIYFSTP